MQKEMKEFTQEYTDHFIETAFRGYILKVSDQQVDKFIKDKVTAYLAEPSLHNPRDFWNCTKELLDWIVYGGMASSFELALLDLEAGYLPPEGAFTQKDGSIHQAPWRQKSPFKRGEAS